MGVKMMRLSLRNAHIGKLFLIFVLTLISCNECKIEDINAKRTELINACSAKTIEEISIVSSNHKLCYIRIKDKKIIDEFRRVIQSNTIISDVRTGQFNRRIDLTVKTKEGFLYTLKLYSQPYYPTIRKDSVDITFYENNRFDVFEMYNESKSHNYYIDYTSGKYGWGNTCYQFRNYQLNEFLNKYIEEVLKEGANNKYKLYIECRSDR